MKLKNYLPFFWLLLILLFIGIFRLLYYNAFESFTLFPDSETYLFYSGDLFHGVIDDGRTPVYPYFIRFLQYFSPNSKTIIVNFQIFISLFSVFIFYKILNLLFSNKYFICVATTFYGIFLPIVFYDKIILTESLSISFVVLFIYIILLFIKYSSYLLSLLISFGVLFLIMLRPSFLYMVPIFILFWLARLILIKHDKKKSFIGLICTCSIIIILFFYSKMNEEQNNFFGITSISNVNLFYNLLKNKLYEKGNDSEITNKIVSFYKTNNMKDSLKIADEINNTYPPDRVSAFISNNIRSNSLTYIKKSLETAISIKDMNIFSNYSKYKKNKAAIYTNKIELFIPKISFLALYIFIFISLPFFLISRRYIIHIFSFSILIWTILLAHTLFIFLGSNDEFSRLIFTAIPYFAVLILICLKILYSILKIIINNKFLHTSNKI